MPRDQIKNIRTIVVMVTWNGLELLKQSLGKLKEQTSREFGIVVVDNGSNDKTREFLQQATIESNHVGIPLWGLFCQENQGFALANNLGLNFITEFLEPDFFILLNNDTLPEEDFIEKMQEKADYYYQRNLEDKKLFPFLSQKEWRVGALAPLIENYFAKGIVDSAGIKIYPDGSAINRGIGNSKKFFTKEKEVFGPTGAANLYFRKTLIDTVLPFKKIAILQEFKPSAAIEFTEREKRIQSNFLFEAIIRESIPHKNLRILPLKEFLASSYFAYYEDVDLAFRMRLRLWGTVFVPQIRILHHHSATGKAYSPFKSFLIHRNQYFNLFRDFPGHYLLYGLLSAVKRYFFLFKSLLRKKGPTAELVKNNGKRKVFFLVIKGLFSLIKELSNLLQDRKNIQANRLLTFDEFREIIQYPTFKASLQKMIFSVPHFLQKKQKD